MTPSDPNPGFPLARAILLALVAGLLGTVVWFGADILALRAKVAALETERDLAKTSAELAQSQLKERTLLAEAMINGLHRQLRTQSDTADAKMIPLTATDGSTASGVLLWDPNRRAGSFVGQRLRVPPEGESYGLWLTDMKTQARIYLGAVHPQVNGTAMTTFNQAPSAADTEEFQEFSVSVEARRTTLALPNGGRVILSSQ